MDVLLAIICAGMAFSIGYFWGNGRITIYRKLTDAEKATLEAKEREFEEAINTYNESLAEIMEYTGEYDE